MCGRFHGKEGMQVISALTQLISGKYMLFGVFLNKGRKHPGDYPIRWSKLADKTLPVETAV